MCFSSLPTINVETVNYLLSVSTRGLQISDTYFEELDHPASLTFLEAANYSYFRAYLVFPNSVQDAILLYVELVAFFKI